MISSWFNRSGIGQMVAPDENAEKEETNDDGLWSVLAPDPKFVKKAPPSDAFNGEILCSNCNGWTDYVPGTTPTRPRRIGFNDETRITSPSPTSIVSQIPSTPQQGNNGLPAVTGDGGGQLFTPPARSTIRGASPATNTDLEARVLSAAKETTKNMTYPSKNLDSVIRICNNGKPINEKVQRRLRKYLERNPEMIHARSTGFGTNPPDGLTPLLVAVRMNNLEAVKIILDLSKDGAALLDVDLQGRSPLHIAAECGHVELLELLQPKLEQRGLLSPPPVDLAGRTPLGRALTSPEPKAKSNRKKMEENLFSPVDPSITGKNVPELDRIGENHSLKINYGFSEMPNVRVQMEDAFCTCSFQKNGKSFFVCGVFDGHFDYGNVSQFVAENIPSVLQENITIQDGIEQQLDWNEIWRKTCLQVDTNLKKADIPGGSTAVMAVITETQIVVANVGDSRAILIQSQKSDVAKAAAKMGKDTLAHKMDSLSLKDETPSKEDPPSLNQTPENDTAATSTPPIQEETVLSDKKEPQQVEGDPPKYPDLAVALSEDHKPDLEVEKARVEKAGLQVVPETFTEHGKEITIHKISNGTDKMAVSRSFGDFDPYKLNTRLPQEEQAVSAVPDIKVHERDHDSDRYLVLACDGVWDVMSNDEVKNFVLHEVEGVRPGMTKTILPEASDALLQKSLKRGSRDNMTTVLVALSNESENLRSSIIRGKALDFSDVKSP